MAYRRSALPVLVGLLSALAVYAGLRAVHPAWRFSTPQVNAFALVVASAGLALSWAERSPASRERRPRRAVATALATALAALSLLAYESLGDVQFPYHRWDQFHYYIGAKYFPELSYTRIYTCTAVAEAERFGRGSVTSRRLRDLAADQVVPAARALDDPEACTRHFSPARWAAFGADIAWFRESSPRSYWARMQEDHGFNPPPTWAVAGRLLASLAPASERTQSVLAMIDPLLLVGAFALVGWAFGPYVLWIALVVWGCQFPAKGAWTAGAFLRQDWFFFAVASVCLLRRGRWTLAGAAIASSAALRVFPALLLGLPALVIARRTVTAGTLVRRDRRFLAGVLGGATVWLVVSTAIFGVDAWRAFADHIALHRAAPLANHIGLRAVLSQTIAGRLAVTEDSRATDPFRVWRAQRVDTFAARRPLYLTLLAALFATVVAASRRIRRLWCALAASTVLVVAAVDIASYYCAVFVVLALLAAATPTAEWLALGAVVVGRSLNALPVLVANPDLQYTVQAIVFVLWATGALVVLAWWPAAGRVAENAGGRSDDAQNRIRLGG